MYIYYFYSFNLTYIKYKYAKIRCSLDMPSAKGVLCYLESSIVFKANVARHVRIQNDINHTFNFSTE